jgi:hypothetical protein
LNKRIGGVISLGFCLVLLCAGGAFAQVAITLPCISGNSVATHTPESPLGDWQYCITIDWNTGANALSHWDLILGLADCPCICTGFPFAAEDTAGTSSDVREEACTVYYKAIFDCEDDPSTQTVVEGPHVKFEPWPDGCEPGQAGTGTFCFYTDWPPMAVPTPNTQLLVKYGPNVCTGPLTGQLPLCTCGPTATERNSWGKIKSIFR